MSSSSPARELFGEGLRRGFVLAVRAWCRYHVKTELFDRTLPGEFSQRDPDSWMPYDRLLSVPFARMCHTETVRFLSASEVTPIENENATTFVQGMSFPKQQDLALTDEEFQRQHQ